MTPEEEYPIREESSTESQPVENAFDEEAYIRSVEQRTQPVANVQAEPPSDFDEDAYIRSVEQRTNPVMDVQSGISPDFDEKAYIRSVESRQTPAMNPTLQSYLRRERPKMTAEMGQLGMEQAGRGIIQQARQELEQPDVAPERAAALQDIIGRRVGAMADAPPTEEGKAQGWAWQLGFAAADEFLRTVENTAAIGSKGAGGQYRDVLEQKYLPKTHRAITSMNQLPGGLAGRARRAIQESAPAAPTTPLQTGSKMVGTVVGQLPLMMASGKLAAVSTAKTIELKPVVEWALRHPKLYPHIVNGVRNTIAFNIQSQVSMDPETKVTDRLKELSAQTLMGIATGPVSSLSRLAKKRGLSTLGMMTMGAGQAWAMGGGPEDILIQTVMNSFMAEGVNMKPSGRARRVNIIRRVAQHFGIKRAAANRMAVEAEPEITKRIPDEV